MIIRFRRLEDVEYHEEVGVGVCGCQEKALRLSDGTVYDKIGVWRAVSATFMV